MFQIPKLNECQKIELRNASAVIWLITVISHYTLDTSLVTVCIESILLFASYYIVTRPLRKIATSLWIITQNALIESRDKGAFVVWAKSTAMLFFLIFVMVLVVEQSLAQAVKVGAGVSTFYLLMNITSTIHFHWYFQGQAR